MTDSLRATPGHAEAEVGARIYPEAEVAPAESTGQNPRTLKSF